MDIKKSHLWVVTTENKTEPKESLDTELWAWRLFHLHFRCCSPKVT